MGGQKYIYLPVCTFNDSNASNGKPASSKKTTEKNNHMIMQHAYYLHKAMRHSNQGTTNMVVFLLLFNYPFTCTNVVRPLCLAFNSPFKDNFYFF